MNNLVPIILLATLVTACSDNTSQSQENTLSIDYSDKITGIWECKTHAGNSVTETSILTLEGQSSNMQREVTLNDSSGNTATFAMNGSYALTGSGLALEINALAAMHGSGDIDKGVIEERINRFNGSHVRYKILSIQDKTLVMEEADSKQNVSCKQASKQTFVSI